MSYAKGRGSKRMRVDRKHADQKTYRMVKSAIENRIETKNFTIAHLGTPVRSAPNGLSIPLSGSLAVGAGNSQRVGNSVTFTSIKYDLFLSASRTPGALLYNNLRMVVYVAKQPSTPITGMAFNSPVDPEAYFVIRDFFIPLGNGPNGTATTRRQGWIKFPKGKKVTYNDGLANSDIHNKMLCYLVSDVPGANEAPLLHGTIRLYYKDA